MSKLRAPKEEFELLKYAATLVEYNSESGEFTWKYRECNSKGAKVFNKQFSGKKLTSTNKYGYMFTDIMMKGSARTHLKLHRLAWFIFYKEIPNGFIDHINQVRNDNRIINLRVVTIEGNNKNRAMSNLNTSGVSGVSWRNDVNKWHAKVTVKGERIHLGYFDDINDAANVVLAFREVNGFSELHGQDKQRKSYDKTD